MAGLTENYTNHAIKSSYIPLIEKMCKDAVKRSTLLDLRRINSPLTRSKGSEDTGMTDASSVCSDIKEEEDSSQLGNYVGKCHLVIRLYRVFILLLYIDQWTCLDAYFIVFHPSLDTSLVTFIHMLIIFDIITSLDRCLPSSTLVIYH